MGTQFSLIIPSSIRDPGRVERPDYSDRTLSEQPHDTLMEATVHWLRHTGISDDVNIRPQEHVRDDASHSSSATTDKYVDIELKERHKSARKKPII